MAYFNSSGIADEYDERSSSITCIFLPYRRVIRGELSYLF